MSLKVLRNIGDTGMIDLVKYNFDDISSDSVDLGPSDTLPANATQASDSTTTSTTTGQG